MGCDIHLYVEKKKNGKWVSAQGLVKDEDGNLDVPYPDILFDDRNYELFAFLAGVRDYWGNQYFKPKGFPKNASEEIKKIYKRWGLDAHTPSYLTLKELKSVNWEDKMIKESGKMDKKQWKKLKKSIDSGKPNWDLLYPHCLETNIKSHVPFEVSIPIKVYLKRFYDIVVERLYTYDWKCKEDEIRIVFWFDN